MAEQLGTPRRFVTVLDVDTCTARLARLTRARTRREVEIGGLLPVGGSIDSDRFVLDVWAVPFAPLRIDGRFMPVPIGTVLTIRTRVVAWVQFLSTAIMIAILLAACQPAYAPAGTGESDPGSPVSRVLVVLLLVGVGAGFIWLLTRLGIRRVAEQDRIALLMATVFDATEERTTIEPNESSVEPRHG